MATKIFSPEKVFDLSGIENSLQNDQKDIQNNAQNSEQQHESSAFIGPAGAPVSSSGGTSRMAIMKSGSITTNPEIEQQQSDFRRKPDGESQYQNQPKPLLH